ncbi:hypothetical protein KFL_004130030 [Klebsormidium nitens]|uniref:Uncharacterized protein n=1 Tax=Klebsormidium nitens TaxID=105231 RepID=A0A1Y1IHY1_KLENI|nr:hypothetical protein KFL_004130030 [Klebsormidium nitens]|eukprot:GAQ88257.1 hypothetical protein KFL_004130030 [Klebsormidium nitens]
MASSTSTPLLGDQSAAMENGHIKRLPAAIGSKFRRAETSDFSAALEKLKDEGKVAPATITYDANYPLRYALMLAGTSVKMCLKSFTFWMVILENVILSYVYYAICHNHENFDGSFDTGGWPYITSAIWGSFGGIVTFMLVFHASDCYSRFQKQYDTVRAIEGSVHTVMGLLRTRIPDDAFPGARTVRNKVAKWAIAQTYLGFGWLPTNRENGVDEWTWERVVKCGLVGNEEIEHLLALHPGEYPVSELESCATQYLWANKEEIGEGTVCELSANISGITTGFKSLYGTTEMPVPFALYHYITLMNTAWLVLISYMFIFYSRYWGIIATILTVLAFQGLREIANVLAEPLGNDETDIPVFDYVVQWHTSMESTINAPAAFAKKVKA